LHTNTYSNAHTYASFKSDTDTYTTSFNAYADAQFDTATSKSHPNRDTQSDSHANANSNSYTDGHAYCNGHANSYSYGDADGNTYT
jgi:hypothetical protein